MDEFPGSLEAPSIPGGLGCPMSTKPRNIEEIEERVRKEVEAANEVVEEYNQAVQRALELLEEFASKVRMRGESRKQ